MVLMVYQFLIIATKENKNQDEKNLHTSLGALPRASQKKRATIIHNTGPLTHATIEAYWYIFLDILFSE